MNTTKERGYLCTLLQGTENSSVLRNKVSVVRKTQTPGGSWAGVAFCVWVPPGCASCWYPENSQEPAITIIH